MFRKIERFLLMLGTVFLGLCVGAQLHALFFSRFALWEFTAVSANPSDEKDSGATDAATAQIDFHLWSRMRTQAYKAALVLPLAHPMGTLTISRLHLTAPIFDDTDEITLNRGLGRVSGTDKAGGNRNLAIAGHRDGLFRSLKDIRKTDVIEVHLAGQKDTYSVDSIAIVDPTDISVLAPRSVPTLTLITCYPFYFVGDAPQRFIVRVAIMRRETLNQQAPLLQ